MSQTARLAAAIVIAFLGIPDEAGSEVYSSATDLGEVFRLERELVGILNGYASKLEARLGMINTYLTEFDGVMAEREGLLEGTALAAQHQQGADSKAVSANDERIADAAGENQFVNRVVGNPIHAYKMMKRFAIDWKRIEKSLEDDDWQETESHLRRKRMSSIVPKEEDLHGSAQALLRLQDVYELDIRKVSRGELAGKGSNMMRTQAGLSAQDCLFLGKHCFNSGALSRSIEWFEEAWVMAGREGNSTIGQEQVQTFLDHAAHLHDERVMKGERSPELFPRPLFEEPPMQQREKIYEYTLRRLKENVTDTEESMKESYVDDIPRFNALCRGEELRPAKYVAKLKCHLDARGDPYYLLHPLMVEVAHFDPEILIFHKIVSTREMTVIRELAAPLLLRSQVQGKQQGSSEVSMTRTSKTGWLQDSFSPVIRSIGERAGWTTGLATDTWTDDAELLQVANYVNGGHYNPHHDYVMKEREPDHMIMLPHKGLYIGDRIATWMLYLNEVPAGGRTVFPRIGASVRPTAGSAVFWHNLHASGGPDRLTLHGACPVLYGTKWVSNKWIREGAQMLRRKCELTRPERELNPGGGYKPWPPRR